MEEKIKLLMENEEFANELFSKEEPEDVQKLFSDNGVELTLDEVKGIGRALEKVDAESGELSEDDLEEVAGGVAVSAIIGLVISGISLGRTIYRNWGRIKRFFRRW